MRLFLGLCCVSSTLFACDCIGPKVHAELDRSDVVFQGVVTNVTQLPSRPDLDRTRSAVTFSVSRSWKGNPQRDVTLHVVAPRGDCLGAHFIEKTEYVVFAWTVAAQDTRFENFLWIGWLDLMPEGTELLTASQVCTNTAEAKKSKGTLHALGKGRKPGD
jgi:hypothetical protein